MKGKLVNKNLKILLLTLFLPLMSCKPPVSSSSNPSVSQDPSSESISLPESSSSLVSSEVPVTSDSSEVSTSLGSETSETPQLEGTTALWPKTIIDNLFSEPARLTIPAFVSPSTFLYQIIATEDPIISIMTNMTAGDPEATYAAQLIAAGWEVNFDYQALMDYAFAVDTAKTMMIFFMFTGQAMLFEISQYDESFFDDLGYEVSEDWPTLIIADFIAPINMTIPGAGLLGPYFYSLPTVDEDSLTILVKTTLSTSADDYLTALESVGWTLSVVMGIEMATNNANGLIITAFWTENILTIVITKGEGGQEPEDWITSSTWPEAPIMSVLGATSLSLAILPFTVTGSYQYLIAPDQFGDSITVKGVAEANYLPTYTSAMSAEGWVVKDAYQQASGIYYAYDPDRTTFLVFIQEGLEVFLKVYKFTFALDDYYKINEDPNPETGEWPAAAILSVYSSVPSTPLPAFVATTYSYEIRNDMYGKVIFVTGTNIAVDVENTYGTALAALNYTVVPFTDQTGSYHYAYDAEQRVIVVYGFNGNAFYITTRDYSQAVIPGSGQNPGFHYPTWPGGRLIETFGEAVTQIIPVFTSPMGYDLEATASPTPWAFITINQTAPVSFENYIALLRATDWVIITLTDVEMGEFAYFVYDPAKMVMMQLRMAQGTVTMDIELYDQARVDAIGGTGVHTYPYTSWPIDFIETTFNTAFANIIPIFTQADGFYADAFIAGENNNELWIDISTYDYVDSEVEVYAQVLINQGWDVLVVEDSATSYYSFIAVDSTGNVMLEFFANGQSSALQVYITSYYQALYDAEVLAHFTPEVQPTSLWPSAAIAAFFPNASGVVPAFYIHEGQTFTATPHENAPISYTVNIYDLSVNDFQVYTSILNEFGYIVAQNDIDHHAIAYDLAQQLMIEYRFAAGCLTIDIFYYSHLYFSDVLFNSIYESSSYFPLWLIELNYGLGVAQTFPTLSNQTYTLYTIWFMFHPQTVLLVISDLATFEAYYASFNGAGWTMSGDAVTGSFIAYDPTGSIRIEASYETIGGLIAMNVYVLTSPMTN